MLEQQNLTRESWLMWNSFTNQASNEIWFAMAVVMKILSFNIYKAMEQKPFARSNRNVQIDQNSRSQQSTSADFQQQNLIVDSRTLLSGLEGVHQWGY